MTNIADSFSREAGENQSEERYATGWEVLGGPTIFVLFSVKVCRSRNFGTSPGLARGEFGPSPKFIFIYVTRTPSKPEWSPIYLQSAVIMVSSIHFSFNA
jgi:hypothetical protein